MAAPRKLRGVSPTEAKPSKPKILVYGRSGYGKTWASMDFPSVYYVDTEGGANLPHYTAKLHKSGGFYFGPEHGANDFDAVTEEIITLATTPHEFRTLVIDSVSKIFNTSVSAEYERMKAAGRDMEKTFGAEKKPAINAMRRWLRWFEKMDMNIILIAHEKEQYRDGKVIGQTFDCWEKLDYELHLVLNLLNLGDSRKVRVTKSRLIQFPNGEIFPWSYSEFADRYGRDVMEGKAVAVRIATPEQQKQYAALLDLVKVDPKILEKWAENCDDLNDLDYDGMQSRIDFLTKKLPKSAA